MSDSPEDSAIILDLARKHFKPAEIQKQLGGRYPIEKIYRVLHAARAGGNKAIPNFREDLAESLVPERIRALLESHAKRRDITVNILVRRILAKVAEDNLIQAVLDDGVVG